MIEVHKQTTIKAPFEHVQGGYMFLFLRELGSQGF